jgi:hypothetical protein
VKHKNLFLSTIQQGLLLSTVALPFSQFHHQYTLAFKRMCSFQKIGMQPSLSKKTVVSLYNNERLLSLWEKTIVSLWKTARLLSLSKTERRLSFWKTERLVSLWEKIVVSLCNTQRLLSLLYISDGFATIKILKYSKIHP